MFDSQILAADTMDVAKSDQSIDLEFGELARRALPELAAFSRSLSGPHDIAEDLVQETLLKAWAARARFQPGTSFRAWTFMILGNLFFSQMRREKFRGPWDVVAADKALQAPATQEICLELDDVCQALSYLPAQQRGAVLLVGVGGYSYAETAAKCRCPVGTVKSRVARGRELLARILEEGVPEHALPGGRKAERTAAEQILGELDAFASQ